MSIRALLIDLDGTIAHLKEAHYIALNRAIEKVAGAQYIITRQEHEGSLDGIPTNVKLGILNNIKKLPVRCNVDIKRLKQELTLEAIDETIVPLDHIIVALDTLKYENKSLKIACVSNSVYATIQRALEKMRIAQYFDKYVSNECVIFPKPKPQPYLTACQFFDVNPRDTVAFEDNRFGMISAARAGCNLCEIRDPSEFTLDRIKMYMDIYS